MFVKNASDVAVTGVDGLSRRRDNDVYVPLNLRFNEKTWMCEQVAIHNGYKIVPVFLSHTDQMHHEVMALIHHYIDYKLQPQNHQRQHDTSSMLKARICKLSTER